MTGKKFVASYSGGKDSMLAIYRAIQAGMEPTALIITYNTDRRRSWFHGIPEPVLDRVSQSLGIPVRLIRTSGEAYAQNFCRELAFQREQGAGVCVFGDIDLQGHLDWGTAQCQAAGLTAYFPLWQESRQKLVYEGIDSGFSATITVVDTTRMGGEHLGRTLTRQEADAIAAQGADICGENGEYHTFVWNGPIFRTPINPRFGDPIVDGKHMILPMVE